MQIKQLEYLMKIVECGSISKAASLLYISQPSLTKSIANLEQEYGVRLLERKARGVELTTEGKEFVRYARKVLTAADALDSNFLQKESKMRAELFVASHQLDFIYECMRKTYEICQERNVHFNLIETDRNDVVKKVLDGQANLGFLVRNEADAKGFLWSKEAKRLEIQVLDQGGFCVLVGPASPFYGRNYVTYEELEDCLQIGLDMEDSVKQDLYFDNMKYDMGSRERMVFFNTARACEHFLLHTDAVMFASIWSVGCFDSPLIRSLPVIWEKEEVFGRKNELLLVKRAGEPFSYTEKIFLKMVYERFCVKEEDRW